MVKVARELLRESQDSLAAKLSLQKKVIQRVERGVSSPTNEEAVLTFLERSGLRFLAPTETRGWMILEKFQGGSEVPPRVFAAARAGLAETQSSLGKKANLGLITISRIELGIQSVRPETKQYLVEFLARLGVAIVFPDQSTGLGWGLSFDFLKEQVHTRHPRPNVQRRKLAENDRGSS